MYNNHSYQQLDYNICSAPFKLKVFSGKLKNTGTCFLHFVNIKRM